MKIISWNINKKELQNEIISLIEAELPDILILCECEINAAELLQRIASTGIFYFYIPTTGKSIKIFSLFSEEIITILEDGNRYSILKISLPLKEDVLLVPLHFPDKRNWSEESQKFECISIADAINTVERSSAISQTIVVGDFNMNPFETGMIAANGFHATRDKQTALKKNRKVNGKYYKFFFNPMWDFYNNNSKTPGTYYYWSSEHICHFWNIFDQIIFRPELISKFDEEDLEIISNFENHNLLSDTGSISTAYSDHLPIKAIFNL